VNDDGDLIPGDDVDESVGVREVTRQRQTRKLSLPHMSFGKLTGSFEDKIIDAFIWLRKQTQGKQIHTTKVQQKSLLKICHRLLAELWSLQFFLPKASRSELDRHSVKSPDYDHVSAYPNVLSCLIT
jgi:hypothetical protein